MYYEYEAHVIFDIYGIEIKIDIPFLDMKPTKESLRDMILEDIMQGLVIKDFDYTTTLLD